MPSDVFGIVGSLQADAFEVSSVVAEGGFAVVYRAHHKAFRADVALKCLKIPGTLSPEQRESFLEQFREEAELLFRLSSSIPAVVRPLHVGTLSLPDDRFAPFIALEWLEGESLAKLIVQRNQQKKPPLSLERSVVLLGPAARALERAHAFPGPHGIDSILHRDLKPDNLFVARLHGQQTIKILDFGISKVKSAATQIAGQMSAYSDEIAAFTPQYGAPEQWVPHSLGQSGTWTDVWGLAVTLVEALVGRPALSGDARAIMGGALDEKRRPTPRTLGVELPERAEKAFKKALAVDPRDRYQDVGAFWDELEACVGVHTPRITSGAALESLPPVASAQGTEMATRIAPLVPAAAAARASDAKKQPRKQPQDVAPRPARAAAAMSSISLMPSARDPLTGNVRSVREPIVANVARVHREPIFPRMFPALKLLGVAAAITVADLAYIDHYGHALTVGPARPFWIAAPLALWALVRIAWVLITVEE